MKKHFENYKTVGISVDEEGQFHCSFRGKAFQAPTAKALKSKLNKAIKNHKPVVFVTFDGVNYSLWDQMPEWNSEAETYYGVDSTYPVYKFCQNQFEMLTGIVLENKEGDCVELTFS